MRLETLKLSELNPAEYNPRTITKEEFEGLKKSLETFGQQENLIVNKDMTVISGHQRLEAMKALGWTEAVCNMVDLDKHQEKKLNVIMNSTAISGKYDDLKLSEILEELKLDDDYESLRLDVLEPLDLSDVEIEEDEAPEVSGEPPKSKLGEVYQLGRHKVMCGDSTDKASVELLMDGEKADMVFTDPPYGMDLDADYADIHTSRDTTALGGGKQRSHTNYEKVIGDSGDFDFGCIATICDMADEVFLWGADYYIDSVPNSGKGGSWIVWNKKPKGDMGKAIGNQFEICWSKQKHKRIVIDYTYSGAYGMKPNDGNRVHPTQKPIDLIAQMFNRWGKDSKNIIDLFLGSGSTLIACEQTDRTCYGCELDEKYVDVVRKRWVKFVHGEDALDQWEKLTPSVSEL